MNDASALLLELVRTPSPSGSEQAVASLLTAWAEEHHIEVMCDDVAVRLEVRGTEPGPTLMLASHLDTVPPGEGWTVDPYAGLVDGTRLTSRGAVDAKASVAAMATAAAQVAAGGGPTAGRLVVLATFSEETSNTTMPEALRRFGAPPEMAVIGEPTSLEPCIAQRGQVLLRPVWEGEQVHAGWAAGRHPKPVNAIVAAAADLVALESVVFDRVHDLLGKVAVTPTKVSAGIARNVTPPRCSAVLDIRTTPSYSHAEVIAAIAGAVSARVEVISERLVPAETPAGSGHCPL